MKTANIGASMKEAQHLTRISTATLAERLGESRQAVYYTRRNVSASIHKVQQLAEIFEMSVDQFISLGHEGVEVTVTTSPREIEVPDSEFMVIAKDKIRRGIKLSDVDLKHYANMAKELAQRR